MSRVLPVLLLLVTCRPAAAPAPPPSSPAPAVCAEARAAFVRRRIPAPPMSHAAAGWLTRPERIAEERPDRLIEALRLRPGMVVADIGAGVGYHTWRIAPRVLPGGRVVATELQPEMLEQLAANVRARGLTNVQGVLAPADATGLPAASVDLALMVDVYHELGEPERFLADLRRALRPGGRLALVEFRAEDPKVPIRREHKMTAADVKAELGAAGFCLVRRDDSLPWQHLLIFEPVHIPRSRNEMKPSSAPQ